MDGRQTRRRFRNFFIKRSIQVRIIAGIVSIVLISVFLTTIIITFVYHTKSKYGSFYYMRNDERVELELINAVGIVLPPVIVIEVVAVISAFIVGLMSSRAVAVPIYKIERWAARLKAGKLNTTLAFRENKRMKDLVIQCNGVTEFFRSIFIDIRDQVNVILSKPDDTPVVAAKAKRIKEVIDKIEVE
ncbi:MAG: hypothetical protein N2053_00635 [Chitinispirillaceae bacterium]|nr:hypothetical protein [Chitinispirillaceae bacterium]